MLGDLVQTNIILLIVVYINLILLIVVHNHSRSVAKESITVFSFD